MIIYKPVTDIDKLKEIYSDISFKNDLIYGGYSGFDENGDFVGNGLFSIDGYNCYLLSVDCDYTDKLLVEGFIRASLNFCAIRNAYMAHCEIEDISDVLVMLGFIKNNSVYSGDIPTLLKGSCCK